MKFSISLILFFCCLTPFSINAQSFQDNFSDGNFTVNPTWMGNTTKFIVSGANQELQLNDPGVSATSYLYAEVGTRDSCTWEFLIRLPLTTTGPSNTNRVKIYLQSNNSVLTGALNGYYLQIGETGSLDALELFKQTGTTSTSILRGTNGTVAGTPVFVRVRIIRDSAYNWEIFADYAGGTNFVSEGIAYDATYIGGSYFGVLCTYSSTQGDKYFFDDFYVSPLFVDVSAPTIVSAIAINSTQVDVLFDEPVDNFSASSAGNYSINNGISVISGTVDGSNPALVHLTVSPLTSQAAYQLTVTDVEDLIGNSIISETANFSFVQIQPASFQDIIINEIMIDPNPVVNLPDAEYVELFNRSNKSVNLTGYKFTHRSASSGVETTKTLGSYILHPNQYVILHNNSAYTPAVNDLQIPSFPALNNTSAYLILKDSSGMRIDSILYTTAWYQDNVKDDGGYSLELINPYMVCKGGNNWIASNSQDGGTPGMPNSVLNYVVDTIAPQITLARQYSVNQVLLRLDDVLDGPAALNTSNYTVSGGLSVVFVQALNAYEIVLTFNANMTAGNSYTITVLNARDCVGNAATRTAVVEYLELTPALHYDILINELLADPTPSVGLPNLEFVELFNRSTKNISLEGWTFSDGSSSVGVFPYYVLKPNEFVILYKKSTIADYRSFGNVIEFPTFPDLNVTSDNLVLKNASGLTIDAVSYLDSWYGNSSKAEGGWTLERINPNKPCEGSTNWTASNAQPPAFPTVGGSPGRANSVLQTSPDVQAPDAIRAFPFNAFNPSNGDSIRIFFTEAVHDNVAANLNNFSIDNGLQIVGAYVEAPNYNKVVLITNTALVRGTFYTITMNSNVKDCVGNPIGMMNKVTVAMPEPIEPSGLLLNEILYDPVVGGVDYIELYNNSSKPYNLADLWVANTTNNMLSSTLKVPSNYLLLPQEYAVLTSKPSLVTNTYTVPGALVNPDINKMVTFTLPTFPDDKGTVILYTVQNNLATFIDSFSYSKSYQSPLIDDKNGVALERIDFNVATSNVNNWHSAAQAVKFGTPTYQNSSFRKNEILDDGIIQIPNNTFSPDGDGYEDFLLINYNIDELGFVGRIHIYDAHGRLVRQLVNNEMLMREGTYYWDGSNDQGIKAPIGIYVVVAEIFHPNGTVKRIKKTCVLASKF